jgi:hypothetical protein
MDEFYNHIVFQIFNNPKWENRLLLRNGTILNSTSLKIINIDSFIDFYNSIYEDTCLAKELTPSIICTGCGSLKQLENLICNPEHILWYNNEGLNIYLFEDLYINTGVKIKNYLEGPPLQKDTSEYYKKYGTSIRGFETTRESLSSIYCFEFDSIKQFVKNNNLKKVTVMCGDYNTSRYLQSSYPQFKIETKNIYVISVAKRLANKKDNFIHPRTPNLITHKFISANGKYKAVRHLTAAYLLDKNAIISFDKNKSIYGSLKNQLWFNLSLWNKTEHKIFNKLITNLKKLEEIPPMTIGNNSSIPNPNFNNEFDYAPINEYEQCFCAVVTETKYSHPVTTFSEKTLNAIYNHRPFILVAPPYTLEYLKKYGFQTFDKFWDESYDREENHEKRLIKIFKLIDYIDNLSLTSLRSLYTSMMPLLKHNYEVIKNIPKEWPL